MSPPAEGRASDGRGGREKYRQRDKLSLVGNLDMPVSEVLTWHALHRLQNEPHGVTVSKLQVPKDRPVVVGNELVFWDKMKIVAGHLQNPPPINNNTLTQSATLRPYADNSTIS
jgi:hypothetical protein